jgi:2-alkyl-3-oxoalkanoate reductase
MNVLVTGATGFLGSHVCSALLKRGHAVSALGRDFSKFNLDAVQICTDLRDAQAIRGVCAGFEVVIHAGALSSSWGKSEDFMSVNVRGTQSVLEACIVSEVRRFVHISSPAVIFDGSDQILAPDNAPYARIFSSHYARTKKLAEELVLNAKDSLEIIVLRPKAIYGPDDRALLPRIIALARAGRLVRIGDGHNLVDLTYVSDVVDAIILAVEKSLPKTNHPVYTITSGEHVNLWQAIRRVLEGLQINANLRVMPTGIAFNMAGWFERFALLTGREPRLNRYVVELLTRTQTYDISRAYQDIGFQPHVKFDQGLQQTLEVLM